MKALTFTQFISESKPAPLNADQIKQRLGQLGLRPKREIDLRDPGSWQGLHSECCGAQYYGDDGRCSRCGENSFPIEADPEYAADLYEGDGDQDKIEDRLRDLGLAPKKEFDERWEEMVDEWGGDPEVNEAIRTLVDKTSQIINKHIDLLDDSEDAEAYEQRQEWIWEQSIDDIGWLEYMIGTGQLYS